MLITTVWCAQMQVVCIYHYLSFCWK